MVRPVDVEVDQMVAFVPVMTILPVPKARVLVLLLDELNVTVVSVLLFRFNVPAVKVNVPVTLGATMGLKSSVVLVVKLTPPPGELTVRVLKRRVTPAVFSA